MTLLADTVLCDHCCDVIDDDEPSIELDDGSHFHSPCVALELADRFDVAMEVLPS